MITSIFNAVDVLNANGLHAVKVSNDELEVSDGQGVKRRVRVVLQGLRARDLVEQVWRLFEIERPPAA